MTEKGEKKMTKYTVEFQGNWMRVEIGGEVLYAEADAKYDEMYPAPYGESNPAYDEAIYPVLKAEIIRQAKEIGVAADCLKFLWD